MLELPRQLVQPRRPPQPHLRQIHITCRIILVIPIPIMDNILKVPTSKVLCARPGHSPRVLPGTSGYVRALPGINYPGTYVCELSFQLFLKNFLILNEHCTIEDKKKYYYKKKKEEEAKRLFCEE